MFSAISPTALAWDLRSAQPPAVTEKTTNTSTPMDKKDDSSFSSDESQVHWIPRTSESTDSKKSETTRPDSSPEDFLSSSSSRLRVLLLQQQLLERTGGWPNKSGWQGCLGTQGTRPTGQWQLGCPIHQLLQLTATTNSSSHRAFCRKDGYGNHSMESTPRTWTNSSRLPATESYSENKTGLSVQALPLAEAAGYVAF